MVRNLAKEDTAEHSEEKATVEEEQDPAPATADGDGKENGTPSEGDTAFDDDVAPTCGTDADGEEIE